MNTTESLHKRLPAKDYFTVSRQIGDSVLPVLLIEDRLQGCYEACNQGNISQRERIANQEVPQPEVLLEGKESFLEAVQGNAESFHVCRFLTEHDTRDLV